MSPICDCPNTFGYGQFKHTKSFIHFVVQQQDQRLTREPEAGCWVAISSTRINTSLAAEFTNTDVSFCIIPRLFLCLLCILNSLISKPD